MEIQFKKIKNKNKKNPINLNYLMNMGITNMLKFLPKIFHFCHKDSNI